MGGRGEGPRREQHIAGGASLHTRPRELPFPGSGPRGGGPSHGDPGLGLSEPQGGWTESTFALQVCTGVETTQRPQ